jgi:hypothetical protein
MQAPGRWLAKGPSFIREVSLDVRFPVSPQPENDKEPTHSPPKRDRAEYENVNDAERLRHDPAIR